MAISVTPNLTLVSNCDATTGWAGGMANFTADTAVYLQGNGALCGWIDNTTSAIQYFTISATNLSQGQHIYVWMMTTSRVDTKANGGFRIVLYTDASNYATWHVGGNDTLSSGWGLFVVDPTSTPTSTVGTFNPASVTRIGVQFKTVVAGKKLGNTFFHNCYWDVVRYGTGLTITSAALDEITLEDIFAIDNNPSNMYGVLQKSYGAYILNGKLTFGGTGSQSIDFEMNGEIILCPNTPEVGDNFNAIEVLGNSSGTSNFRVEGSFIRALNKKITINLDNANLDEVFIKGSSIINADPAFRDGQNIEDNVFGQCMQIIPKTAVFEGNTVKETKSTVAALLYPSSYVNIKNNQFMNNTLGAAVELDTEQTYVFNGEKFFDNTYDILNTSLEHITINVTNGGNPATFTPAESVTINNTVTLTISGLVENTEVRIIEAGTKNEVAGVENSGTSFSWQYNYPQSFTHVNIFLINVDYEWMAIFDYELPSLPSSIPVSQKYDPWVERGY